MNIKEIKNIINNKEVFKEATLSTSEGFRDIAIKGVTNFKTNIKSEIANSYSVLNIEGKDYLLSDILYDIENNSINTEDNTNGTIILYINSELEEEYRNIFLEKGWKLALNTDDIRLFMRFVDSTLSARQMSSAVEHPDILLIIKGVENMLNPEDEINKNRDSEKENEVMENLNNIIKNGPESNVYLFVVKDN